MSWEIISKEEMERQAVFARKVKDLSGGGHYFIETFGCQMNVNDSQKLAGMLEEMGYEPCADKFSADVIVFNTCCIRDSAEKRIIGHIGTAKKVWEKNRRVIVCVCGCMTQQDGAAESLLKRHPFVSVVFGTNQAHMFPRMIFEVLSGGKRAVYTGMDEAGGIAEGVPAVRENKISVFSTIMYGCDNFCSYCVVPYVRGRERSRSPGDIIRELEGLAESGVKEVTLLGQNVNSYGKGMEGGSFSALLRMADKTGIPRIRFMTSHPKDISREVLEVMAEGENICKQLHLPVQSGSDRILSLMNRHYDTRRYLDVIKTARELMPGVGLTTDIIVGFPGETDGDFRRTLELLEEVRFDGAYTFKFSRRKGTKAHQMEGQISDAEKKSRIMELIEKQDAITSEICAGLVGTNQIMLADGISRRSKTAFSGRIDRGLTVNVTGEDILGRLVEIKITRAKRNTLEGAPIPNKGE